MRWIKLPFKNRFGMVRSYFTINICSIETIFSRSSIQSVCCSSHCQLHHHHHRVLLLLLFPFLLFCPLHFWFVNVCIVRTKCVYKRNENQTITLLPHFQHERQTREEKEAEDDDDSDDDDDDKKKRTPKEMNEPRNQLEIINLSQSYLLFALHFQRFFVAVVVSLTEPGYRWSIDCNRTNTLSYVCMYVCIDTMSAHTCVDPLFFRVCRVD